MTQSDTLKASLLTLDQNPLSFERLALDVFKFQYKQNSVYKQYIDLLKIDVDRINRVEKIPFLPIEFFKNHIISSSSENVSAVFESSGTTLQSTSKHYVTDLPFYEYQSKKTFELTYGPLTDFHVFALLPSYLERNNSSLVYMVQNFIFNSYSLYSGFFLNNIEEMVSNIKIAAKDNRKILLIGVTFGLLDLAENKVLVSQLRPFADKIVLMETGGMKGRRKEMVREELHAVLKAAYGVKNVHSEYGMTELLSQAYSKGNGVFEIPNTMRILLREVNDPFTYLPSFGLGKKEVKYRGRTGGVNVIDLANIDSCAFIETKDLGSYTSNYQNFNILGRFDHADLRGCNLMVS